MVVSFFSGCYESPLYKPGDLYKPLFRTKPIIFALLKAHLLSLTPLKIHVWRYRSDTSSLQSAIHLSDEEMVALKETDRQHGPKRTGR